MSSVSSLGWKAAPQAEWAGELDLHVVDSGHRTTATSTHGQGVLRLMQPLYLDDTGQLTYMIINPGGAYFGEKYRIDVRVGEGAKLVLASQGATRIHRTPTEPAEQHLTFTLASGSRLEYVPDQTIAYRDADYRQYTTVTAAPNAQGFFGEIVTPGWDAQGEKFTYAGMRLRFDIVTVDERPVCIDNLNLRPRSTVGLEGIGHLEGASHMGSALIVGPHCSADYAGELRDVAADSGIAKVGVTHGARHGISWVLVRALGNSTDSLHQLITDVNARDRSKTTGQKALNLRRY